MITQRITQINVLLGYLPMLVSLTGSRIASAVRLKLNAKIQHFCNRQPSLRSLQSIQLKVASEERNKAWRRRND